MSDQVVFDPIRICPTCNEFVFQWKIEKILETNVAVLQNCPQHEKISQLIAQSTGRWLDRRWL